MRGVVNNHRKRGSERAKKLMETRDGRYNSGFGMWAESMGQ